MTISDIAKLAGVSKTTVSFYLNGKYEKMSEETRQRIEKVIEKTGYEPSVVARSLNFKQTKLIGVIIGDITNSFANQIVKGIDALGRHEWNYEIPLQGENELTELATRVNELSKEEQTFQEKEKQLQEEKISLIRSLSHDIRTPLTSMMSYSELLKQKET
ncbi:MAG: LacI family DNA-binding transcriptional regulator, partial [Erysipelotrichaceae bacterium]|nr:LacI family DNA-binding transcriptional regulator [Erysipelotrichaceae bacterium]